jgi:hypothetical protein
LERIDFGVTPEKKDLPVVYKGERHDESKPWGSVWWGVGGDWIRWLSYEAPDWLEDRYPVISALYLDDSGLLTIENDSQLEVFTAKYPDENSLLPKGSGIHWDYLKDKGFSGIEIPTYLQKSRYSRTAFWYYGWDCASGAVWDQKAILKHKPLFFYDKEIDLWVQL